MKSSRTRRRLANLLTLRKRKPKVGATPADVVHTENKWRLLRYRPRPEGLAYQTPVVMVPSLINRHYVLDLMPGKSLAEWLVARGHDVYIVDWGRPSPEDRFLDLDTITDDYIGRAVRKAARGSARGKAHLLGYCLGGTLTAAYTAARPEHVASMLTLAAPVAFEDEGLLATWVRSPTFDIDALIAAFGNVPWPLMQAAFHMLRPTLGLAKAVYLLDRAWDDEFLDGFLALETWGNDNVSFPGEAYRRYIQELYRDNRLVAGTFRLHGRPARLTDITCPVRAYTFQHDNIVPWKSAAALVDQVASEDKERVDLPGGHVGAVVSRKASQTLWPHMAQWWAERDAEPARTLSAAATARKSAAAPARTAAAGAQAPAKKAGTAPAKKAEKAPAKKAEKAPAKKAEKAPAKTPARKTAAKKAGKAAPAHGAATTTAGRKTVARKAAASRRRPADA